MVISQTWKVERAKKQLQLGQKLNGEKGGPRRGKEMKPEMSGAKEKENKIKF